MIRARIRRTRDGHWQLRLPAQERDLLRALPSQVRDLIAAEDPSAHRLFPPAYTDDREEEAEYRRLMGDQLIESHQAALSVLEETVDSDHLDDEQVQSWLGALNDLRLVLGTRLEVTEDLQPVAPSDPRAPAFATYAYLSLLQERMVEAVSATI
ncbi:MAG: DUF2017 family protein [Acidimicrobiales bacterium]